MSVLNKISTVLGLGGKTQRPVAGADRLSTLHNTTSINGIPKGNKPSKLDLDGNTPLKYKNPETGITY